ncbi:MAG: YbjQ family protein [Steroidobacteraceae bacterium]
MIGTVQTTTTFELSGFRITKSLGVVRGITVRTRSLPLSILGGLRTLFGGRAGIFSDLCEAAREESFQLMMAHARKLGANAVVGVRYDTGPMVGAAEVLCYGTAVIIEPT